MNVPKARKLPSGTWFIQLRLGGESIPVSGATEKAVIREAERIKADYRTGAREERSKAKNKASPTIGEAMGKYISERENVLSPSTVRSYEIIRNRLKFIETYRLSDMNDGEWQRILNTLAAKYKPKTMKNTMVFLRSAVGAAGYSMPDLELPQAAPRKAAFLNDEEILKFIKAVADTDIAVPALLALSSMRVSEIKGLRWENIEKDADFVRVEDVIIPDKHNKPVRKDRAKNISSTRNVPILIPELKAALERDRKPSGPVMEISDKALRYRLAKVCREAGITVVGIHGLRHSFASLAYHLKMPELIAMEIGGWSDAGTMRRIYTHIAQSDIDRYKGVLSDFYAGNKGKNANKNANEAK